VKKILFWMLAIVLVIGCEEEQVQLSDEEQKKKDLEIIDQWLIDNHITAESDSSGLRYVIANLGTGAKPVDSSSVTIMYTGLLLVEGVMDAKSKVFEQPVTPPTLKLSSMIQGLQIGLKLLPKASKAVFFIPSGLAHGKKGVGSTVPPNSNLYYEIELQDVK